ncbi:hypothetical protein SSPS47_32895 [Streptomyces sp. S4.7]|nr:hypothetical protein SSPS47_32895 [Streptomyces sp. S4.7]
MIFRLVGPMTFTRPFGQLSAAKWSAEALLETFFRSVPTLNVHGETKDLATERSREPPRRTAARQHSAHDLTFFRSHASAYRR